MLDCAALVSLVCPQHTKPISSVGETVGSWFAVIHSGSIFRRRMDQFPMIPSSTWRLKPILKKRGQSDAVREEI